MRFHFLSVAFCLTFMSMVGGPLCGQSIEGTVLNADGSPAHTGRVIFEEVAVSVEKQTPSGTWGRFGGAAHTDERGRYHFDGLPPGKYIVFAALPGGMVKVAGGRISAGGPIIFAPGTPRAAKATIIIMGSNSHPDHIDIQVPADNHHVAGVAVDAAGRPVRRGLVRLYSSGEPGLSRAMPLTEKGSFDFDRVSSEKYTLHASTGESWTSEASTADLDIVVQSSGEPKPIRLVLK